MGTFIGTSTGIGSSSNDVENIKPSPSILDVLPTLTYDQSSTPTIYMYFLLATGVDPVSMKGTIYWKDRYFGESTFLSDGSQFIVENPLNGSWYVDLEIVIDSVTTYNFISNTLIILN